MPGSAHPTDATVPQRLELTGRMQQDNHHVTCLCEERQLPRSLLAWPWGKHSTLQQLADGEREEPREGKGRFVEVLTEGNTNGPRTMNQSAFLSEDASPQGEPPGVSPAGRLAGWRLRRVISLLCAAERGQRQHLPLGVDVRHYLQISVPGRSSPRRARHAVSGVAHGSCTLTDGVICHLKAP